MPMISIDRVSKWYGPQFQVLKDCTTTVAAGEIVEDALKEDFFGSLRSQRAQTFLSKILAH